MAIIYKRKGHTAPARCTDTISFDEDRNVKVFDGQGGHEILPEDIQEWRSWVPGSPSTCALVSECDCGAVKAHGKNAPKRVHAHWCSSRQSTESVDVSGEV